MVQGKLGLSVSYIHARMSLQDHRFFTLTLLFLYLAGTVNDGKLSRGAAIGLLFYDFCESTYPATPHYAERFMGQ